MAKKVVKAEHGDHTGRPSAMALCSKVTNAIQEDARFDTDQHGQPEGSPGDIEPYCFDITVPDDKGHMFAVIRSDDGKLVKIGFTYDQGKVAIDVGQPEAVEATTVYAQCEEAYKNFVKAAGTPDGAGKGHAARKSSAANAASQAAHEASATAHDSDDDDDHQTASTAHEAASEAHKKAMLAQAKAGNKGAASDHAKAMAAHDVCADAHDRKDSEAVKAVGTDYSKFLKAGSVVPEVVTGFVQANESTVELDTELPTSEFMWMPGGLHTIRASYDGKPAVVTISCDPVKTAGTVQASFARILERCGNRKPFGCIQHKEEDATFWPQEFVAHEDGVYCKAEWTELGLKCVRGKTMRSFSPSFSCDADWVKAMDNGEGVLVFPEGARGSATNPARVTGVSPKSVGSLTNWPAFKAILPVKANQADPQPATTKPAEHKQQEPKMKIKFVRASSDGKHAAGIVADIDIKDAAPYLEAGEAMAPAAAEQYLRAQQTATDTEKLVKAQNTALVKQAIVRAISRNALPANDKEGKEHADTTKALVKAEDYLSKGVPVTDVCEIIDGMPGKEKPGTGLVRASLFERQSGSNEGNVVRIDRGNETVEEACAGIIKAYEPMVSPVNGSMGLVKAGMLGKAIEASRFIANKYKTAIEPLYNRGDDFSLMEVVKAADTTDANLGTIATGLLLMRNLGFLKNKLVPLAVASTDLSAEPVKFNQQVITRYIKVPNVLTFKAGVGYTNAAGDTTRTVSTATTVDVAINMAQNKAVCIQFDTVKLGSTMRNLFAEQQGAQFYGLAQAINQHFISTAIAANWTPITQSGAALNPPKFNSNAWNIPSLVTIKNKMTLAQIPDQGRHVLLHSFFHDILLQDSNLLTAYVIKAALQQQANRELTNFGQPDLPNLFGLMPHESQLFSDVAYADANWQPATFGMALTQSAMLFVSRIPQDYNEAFKDIPATAAIQVVTEPDSNLSMLFSKWVDNGAKQVNAECALMYQAGQGDPRQGFLLNTVGGAQN